MRKLVCLLILATFFALGYGYGGAAEGTSEMTSPTVVVAGPIKMTSKAKAVISGQGFKPGQAFNILFMAKDEVQSDIVYALKPAPKSDDAGAWSATWACSDFIKRKMVEAGGSYKITVTDDEYNPIAHTYVTFTK